jgi:hypothetical protein
MHRFLGKTPFPLIFTPAEWQAFTARMRDSEFNLP